MEGGRLLWRVLCLVEIVELLRGLCLLMLELWLVLEKEVSGVFGLVIGLPFLLTVVKVLSFRW